MNISGDQPPDIQLVLHKTRVHSLLEAIWILSDTHIEPLVRVADYLNAEPWKIWKARMMS